MRIHPVSFLLGLGAASLVPLVTRVFRPLAVEVTAAGMGLVEDARRALAEQMETLEDIAAEARARREEAMAAAANGTNGNGYHPEPTEDTETAEGATTRPRRRAPARRRAP